MNLYITADKVGIQTGGGLVTSQEWQAMQELQQPCFLLDRDRLYLEDVREGDPWNWDHAAYNIIVRNQVRPKLAHFYAGTFSRTINYLKDLGCKITYTAAAHDIAVSNREHKQLGLPFNLPHLTVPELWERYVEGYKLADVLICPGTAPAETKKRYGCENRIEIIPHGTHIPDKITTPPADKFVVGYMGAIGADKGVRYLLEAWKQLDYQDSVLVLAGKDSQHPFMNQMIQIFGKIGTTVQLGWVNNIADFYNNISLYVQPSATEGFGIEVVEAMAHGRPVICSDAAGAADLVPELYRFPACSVETMAKKIDALRDICTIQRMGPAWWENWRHMMLPYEWSKIRERYTNLWSNLI